MKRFFYCSHFLTLLIIKSLVVTITTKQVLKNGIAFKKFITSYFLKIFGFAKIVLHINSPTTALSVISGINERKYSILIDVLYAMFIPFNRNMK